MAPNLKTPQTIALVAAAICLTCACGIPLGPQEHYPPPAIKRSLALRNNYPYFQTKVGTSSNPWQISLKNISGQPVDLEKPTLYSIHHGDAFHLETTCGATLAPDATCFITLTFSPTRKANSEAGLLFSAKPNESYGLILRGYALTP